MRRLASTQDLTFKPHVSALVTDMPRRDLERLEPRDSGGPLFVLSETVEEFIGAEITFCRRHADMLAGYSTPLPILEECAAASFVALMNDISDRRAGPLVIHDLRDRLDVVSSDILTVFDVTTAPAAARSPDPIELPSEAQVLQHASFIGSTDRGALRDMHKPVHRRGYDPLFRFWIENLRARADSPTHGDIVADAMDRIDLIRPS
ncbi:hypothetical protein [Pontivivens ytuae]|uniref:Uncharacterized protein n=1 Tax=Pontivivens ytuae TaxID=2789856 RepID=A0A7S9LPF6_9RHOB|nr:hypothetical protein [Pontivivens ytuae]QPH52676.1 hypothetical protein I0K15_12735 [Pontivivens ytuae]